ncbi:5-formyltetrahydrofolate cyclo-ligase [Nanoarchaeota archaeon]
MKKSMRTSIRDKRKNLPVKWILANSKKVTKKLLPRCKKFKNIMVYASFDGEVDTHVLINELLKQKKNVILPKIRDRLLMPIKISGFEDLLPGRYGILEPQQNTTFPIKKIDLIILPGVCFDKNCHRIGFGEGYYDKFLPKLNCPIIALAFDFQIVEKIQNDPHDVPVDLIITEKRIIKR